MKYNISINPDDYFNEDWRGLVRNGDINIVIYNYSNSCNVVLIFEVIGYSDHLCKYDGYELVQQFYSYAFKIDIPSNLRISNRVFLRSSYDENDKAIGIIDFMLRIHITLDQLELMPNEISTAVLMNLNCLT